MTKKKILYGEEARNAVFAGAKKIRDIVASTLGPNGCTVMIEQEYGDHKVTKDGVTVAKAVELENPFENLGAKTLRSVALKMSEGDGTTSSIVFSYALLEEARKYIVAGYDLTSLINEIDAAIEETVTLLRSVAKPIRGNNELIKQVATISANGDEFLGSMIARASESVGEKGIITVEESKTGVTELDVVDGMQLDKGFIAPYFITNAEKGIAELSDNVYVLVYQDKISNFFSLVKLLEQVARNAGSLWIIADDIEGDALSGLILNKLQNKIKVFCTKAPGFGDNKAGILNDVAVLTGTRIMSVQTNDSLETLQLQDLGKANRVIASKDHTIISGGQSDKAELDAYVKNLETLAEENSNEHEKEKLLERIAKLTNGIGVIKVGGYSSLSMGELKDRAEDAVNAVQAAINGGILPGGGSAFLYASLNIKAKTTGAQLLKDSLTSVTTMIATNAGLRSPGSVVEKILEKNTLDFGYDARRGKFGSMYDFKVIDAADIACAVLRKGFDGVKTLISTSGVICIIPETPAAKNDNEAMY